MRTILFSILLVIVLVSFFSLPPQEEILLEHLYSGRTIFSHSFFPENDPFSFFLSKDTWQNPYWFSEFLLYAVYSLTGIQYLWLIPIFFCFPFFFFLKKHHDYSLPLAVLLIWIAGSYNAWRPGIIFFPAFLALCFHHCLLLFFQENPKRKLLFFLLLFLQTLWVHSHPSCFLGPLSCLFFLLDKKVKKEISGIALLFFLMSSCLSIPYNFSNLYAFLEYQQTNSCLLWPGFWLMMLFLLWLYWKQQRLSFACSSILLSWMAFCFLDPGWIIPLLAWNLYLILPSLSIWIDRRKPILSIVAIAFIFSWVTGIFLPVFPEKANPEEKPVQAANFLQNIPPNSLVFHDPELSPYLLWFGQQKAFIDRRNFLYPQSLQKEVDFLYIQPQNFASLERRFAFRVALLDLKQEKNQKLIEYLSSRMNWHLIYCDSLAVIFLKSEDNAYASLIEKHKIYDLDKPIENPDSSLSFLSLYRRGETYLSLNFLNRAQSDIKEMARRQKSKQEECLYFLLYGKYLTQKGDLSKAMQQLQESWNQDKQNPEILKAILRISMRNPEMNDARGWCNKAMQLHKGNPEIAFLCAQVLYILKDMTAARNIIEDIVRFYPEHEQARSFLIRLEKELQSQSMQGYLEQAKVFMQSKRYNHALQILEKAMQKDNRFWESYVLSGEIHLLEERYSKAASCFKEALRLSPGHLLSATKLAVAIANMGEWESALKILLPLSKSYQDRYEVRDALFLVDNIAIASLKKILEKKSETAALENLVHIWERREDFQLAIDAIESHQKEPSQEWKKRLASLYFQEAKKKIHSEMTAQGFLLLQKSIDLYPDFFESHLFSGTLALKRKDWEKAFFHFENLKRIAPLDERGSQGISLIELGKALNLQLSGEYEEALQKFQAYLEKAPSGAEKEQTKIWIKNLSKKNQEMQSSIKQNQARISFEQATLSMKEENWKEAIFHFSSAIENDPLLAEAFLNRGKCYLLRKDKDFKAAQEDIGKAFSLKPHWPQAHFQMGYLYSHLGDYPQAQRHLKQYLQQEPEGKYKEDVETLLKSFEE